MDVGRIKMTADAKSSTNADVRRIWMIADRIWSRPHPPSRIQKRPQLWTSEGRRFYNILSAGL